jgi:ABC-2 type transport system permease protein
MRRRIISLMVKEFLALMKDKKSRLVVIVPPLIQLLVFGYAATFDLRDVPYAIYNEDPGAASRELLSGFQGSSHFLLVAEVTHEGEIAPLINERKALMVVHSGPRFTADLLRGRPSNIQLIVDGRNSNTALLALNYAQTIIGNFNEQWTSGSGKNSPPARLSTRAWFNPNLESRWFFLPGIVGLLLMVVVTLVTSLSVAREREQGTFDQLLVTPMRPVEILIGKALPGFLIGLAEATVIILVAVNWFRVPLMGSLVTLYFGTVIFLLSAVGVGLMISSLSVTQQQGLLGAFLFLVPSILLSGFTTPIANMPAFIQTITFLNPMRYFMVVLRGVFLEGMPFHLLIGQFWPMAAIGSVNLAAATWLFRRRMY